MLIGSGKVAGSNQGLHSWYHMESSAGNVSRHWGHGVAGARALKTLLFCPRRTSNLLSRFRIVSVRLTPRSLTLLSKKEGRHSTGELNTRSPVSTGFGRHNLRGIGEVTAGLITTFRYILSRFRPNQPLIHQVDNGLHLRSHRRLCAQRPSKPQICL